MLPREKRITDNKHFQKIFRKGRRISSPSYIINVLESRSPVSKIGIIVGKKYSKKATERNKAKRIIREAVKELYPTIKNGTDIIISVKGAKTSKPKLVMVTAEIRNLLTRLGVLK